MNPSFVKILKGSQGLALFMVIFVMAFFLLFVTGGLIFSQLELKKTSNFKLATQAIETADAGLQHAWANIETPFGWNFNALLNCASPPCTIISQTPFPSGSAFSYTVTAENDPPDTISPGSPTNDTNNIIILNSTANGPNGTKKQVQAYVKRSLVSFTSPGSLYLPASSATITLTGTNFLITGNDTNYDGTPATNPKPAITGAAPINNTVRDAFKSALGSSRYNQVQGQGYDGSTSPVTPSVITTNNVFDVNKIGLNFYNQPSAVKYLNGLEWTSANCPSRDPCTLGTNAAPQITYIKEVTATHIHLTGYIKGSGVLIVEGGKTHLGGNFNFNGLVVGIQINPVSASGEGHSFFFEDDAKIFGALIMGPTNGTQVLRMSNNAKIYYSSQALTMANNLCGTCLAQPSRVFAWLDK